MFNYKIENIVYSIDKKTAQLSELFSYNIMNDIELKIPNYKEQIAETLYEYFTTWQSNIEAAHYKINSVQNSDKTQVLNPKDIHIIDKYIKKTLPFIKDINHTLNIYNQLAVISVLLSIVDDYLRMPCFTLKLQAYSACLLWECSLSDMNSI